MKKEVLSAANLLIDLLRLNSSEATLTEEQLQRFRDNVCECLWNHYQNHWFPDKPLKGSGYRCIRINGTMDPVIAKAGTRMGLRQQFLHALFPSELTMWVDPLEVSYRIGENGSICVLFGPNSNNEEKPSSVATTASSTENTPQSPPLTKHQQKPQLTPSKPPLHSSPSQASFRQSPPPKYPISTLVHPGRRSGRLSPVKQRVKGVPINPPPTGNCKESLRAAKVPQMIRDMELLYVTL